MLRLLIVRARISHRVVRLKGASGTIIVELQVLKLVQTVLTTLVRARLCLNHVLPVLNTIVADIVSKACLVSMAIVSLLIGLTWNLVWYLSLRSWPAAIGGSVV